MGKIWRLPQGKCFALKSYERIPLSYYQSTGKVTGAGIRAAGKCLKNRRRGSSVMFADVTWVG